MMQSREQRFDLPADYGDMLPLVTETFAFGHGSRPTDDVEHVTGPGEAVAARPCANWPGHHR
jgi:hypothetical protein